MNDTANDNYLALLINREARDFEPKVLQLLRDSKIADSCYAYKMRTKPKDKLLSKVELKRAKKPDYSLYNVTDVVGLRLVALFKCDMADLFESVLSAISHTTSINPNPFTKNGLREIIVYKGRQAFEEMTPKFKDIAEKYFPAVDLKEVASREGYSSLHIVTNLDFEHTELPTYNLPIEIQIRTVFEDAWGEIDHKYGYLIRSGKGAGKPTKNTEHVLSHLKILKQFTDACMDYADSIRNEATDNTSSQQVAPRKVLSVAADEFILQRFSVLHIAESLISKYSQARLKKNEGSESNNAPLLLEAAECFKSLGDQITQPLLQQNDYIFYYYCRMNEAFCLMSTNVADNVSSARHIYQLLEDKYVDFPLVKMRLGQALSKLKLYDAAISNFEHAGELLKSGSEYVGRDENNWPDSLPQADYVYMRKAQPKLLGYNKWLKLRSLDRSELQKICDLFIEAYDATYPGLKITGLKPEEELSLHNNALYYCLGALTHAQQNDIKSNKPVESLKISVKEHVQYIEEHTKEVQVSLSTADTLMKAYHLLGDETNAKKFASQVTSGCLDSSTKDLSDSEKLAMMREADLVQSNQKISVVI
ncbi:MAG TPA: RelA/SpoT domain-containing protein [Methylophilus sp.]|nr:RelA/SpoT domain-containing protein [Methylophilus sp.]